MITFFEAVHDNKDLVIAPEGLAFKREKKTVAMELNWDAGVWGSSSSLTVWWYDLGALLFSSIILVDLIDISVNWRN